jgi:ABC-type enterochelin transport system ATPase subunit
MLYSKTFDTDYMLIDEPDEKLKIFHYTGVGRTVHENNTNALYKYWKQ